MTLTVAHEVVTRSLSFQKIVGPLRHVAEVKREVVLQENEGEDGM